MGIGFTVIVLVGVGLVSIMMLQSSIAKYNAIIRLRNNVRKSWSNINVLLKQRNDEIPNLVSVVKGYAKHEKEILEKVTEARNTFMKAKNVNEKVKADYMISSALKSLFAVVENYPNLKANENFLKLQDRITGIENRIADRREFYNDSVTVYNTRIQSVPDKYIAKMIGCKKGRLFRIRK